jgi:Ca2+-transporting ATPase
MITGDHASTAAAIAERIKPGAGLSRPTAAAELGAARDGYAVLTGASMAQVSDSDLPAVAERTHVFARMTPEQKLRLVKALQSRGHVVAMTGDGVNDAPALRQADIGVAMGITGTEVAKEAADMVLADDNFASIEAAVEEGRTVFDNLTKFIVWTLPTNVGEGMIILTGIAVAGYLPILPVQALYINMSTALLIGMPLVFERKEADIMARPPRDPAQPIMTYELFMRSGLMSILLTLGGFGLFEWANWRGMSEAQARTVAVSVVVFGQAFYLFNCRSLIRSIWSVGWFTNPWVWAGFAGMVALQMAFAYAPVMQRLFRSAPLDLPAWGMIFAVAGGIALIVAIEKAIRRRVAERKAQTARQYEK